MIRGTKRKLRPLIENANLTMRQENDIEGLLDREVRLIHLEQKHTISERIAFWKRRQMSDSTRAFKHRCEMGKMKAFDEQVRPYLLNLIQSIPKNQRTEAVMTDIFDQAWNSFNKRGCNVVSCRDYMQEVVMKDFVPQLRAKENHKVATEAAIKVAVKESEQAARLYMKQNPSH